MSPHRVAIAAKKKGKTRVEATRREYDEDEQADCSERDEDSLDEEEEEDEQVVKARRKREGLDHEPLTGLSAELQEALIVEDLLFVLMVSLYAGRPTLVLALTLESRALRGNT